MNQGWIVLLGMWVMVTSWVVRSDEFDDLDALQQLNEMDRGLLDFDFDREKEPDWQQNIERELADLEREHLSDMERNDDGGQVDQGLDEAEELQEAMEELQESIEEESGDIESRDDEQGEVFEPDTGEDNWPEEQDDDFDFDDDQGEDQDHDDDEDDDDKKGNGIPDFVLDLLEELGKGDKG